MTVSVTQAELTDQQWTRFLEEGRARAEELGNRGPIRFDDEGRLAPDVLDAYRRNGFYVFTGVLSGEEVAELEAEFDDLIDNAPVERDGQVDAHGRPVRHSGYYSMSSDTLFGQDGVDGQGPAVVGLVSHPLMLMDAALRVYGHPEILKMVENVNGADFVPFHESIFHKPAGTGPPTPWHQDGRTHWAEDGTSLEGDDGGGESHGLNLSVSWSHCTPENCLWVVPGSHRRWVLAGGGSFPAATTVMPEAVPMLLEPGDCGMVNRSSLHGSFRNDSTERRVTMVLGFHKRSSAIGTTTTNVHSFQIPGGGNSMRITYDDDYVLRRARMIPLAIDARRQRWPEEQSYRYRGDWIGSAEWSEGTREEISREGDEYWRRDITL
ncbi:MAG: phytanoyl-CoA dioxygenase family protein [Acidimicrobiales bacterium]